MVKARDSQFELLRILAMLYIVTHHLVIKGADTVGYVTPYDVNTHGIAGVIINSMVVGGGKFVRFNYSSKDFESLWLLYQAEGLPKNISIEELTFPSVVELNLQHKSTEFMK